MPKNINFEKNYWKDNYSDLKSMDGIGNAKNHVNYLKSLLELEFIDINSILDLGFGTGHLFRAMLKQFKPYKAMGIEPSTYIFERATKRPWNVVESTNLRLLNVDIRSWLENEKSKKWSSFDMCLCTSVFQYIETKDLEFIIPKLAKKVKYLYLTVPTDVELQRQVSELNFHDKYAIRRGRKQYQMMLEKNFTFISSRLLESKNFFSEETTAFTDLLYRF